MTSDARTFITVVSGLPRSGTSLMMQMLRAGGMAVLADDRRAPDADNPRGYFEYQPVTRLKLDRSWLPQAVGKVVKIVHLLLLELPPDHDYRVILMQRDLSEIVRSQALMLQRSGARGAGLAPAQLEKAYAAQMAAVKAALAEHANFKSLEVRYDRLIADPKQLAREVDEFLGGGLDRAAMAAAVDPALYRNRAPGG